MPPEVYKPHAVAQRLGVHSNTVRLWCRDFAEFLSPTANPTAGEYRKFTADDLVVLQHVAEMAREKVPLATVRERLRSMAPADLHAPVVDALQPGQGAQEGRSGELVAAAVVDAMRSEFAALQARLAETGAQVQAAHALAAYVDCGAATGERVHHNVKGLGVEVKQVVNDALLGVTEVRCSVGFPGE